MIETTHELLKMYHDENIHARKHSATDRSLLDDPEVQHELWALITAGSGSSAWWRATSRVRLAIIEMGVDAELKQA